MVLFLIGLLITTGGLLITSGFVFGSTRGLLLFVCMDLLAFDRSRRVCKYVRLSEVLPFESTILLDLLELELNRGDLFEDLRP